MFTCDHHPDIVYIEEVMREGMQIEGAAIAVADKVALLDALSQTGLDQIAVGSFVSARYTPQMACMEELASQFTPRPGVTYLALALNARGAERAQAYAPPLTIERGSPRPRLSCHMCDVFVRRNINRSQADEVAAWPGIVAKAKAAGRREASIGVNAAFGSNFLGDFPIEAVMRMLEIQHAMWHEAAIPVTELRFGDPMGWCHPAKVTELLARCRRRWPALKDFSLHLHNSRGMAMACIYAGILALDASHTLRLEGTLGGIGGCPYCGNGRATGMVATEDLVHMLDGMGYRTSVDMRRLLSCVDMLERMIGRASWGHVSRAGPRPADRSELLDINAPFIETLDQAQHFRRGPAAYEGGVVPWREPIQSAYRDRIDQGLPAYDVDGDWPWTQPHFPQPPRREQGS
ncbi:MAG: hypothetical protein ACKVP1_12075 [Burkholderiaceae bacterium]